MGTTRYAIIKTASIDGSFRNAVDRRLVPATRACWVRRIGISRARSTYGMREVKVSTDLGKALTWATREAAEAKASDLSSDYVTYEVREVEVVETYGYDRPDAAQRCAIEADGVVRREGDSWTVLRAKAGA